MIIPAIDLIDGQVVRLYQGDYNQKTTFAKSPLRQLNSYQAQGASWLHLVDLNGAKDPDERQTELIKTIAAKLIAKLQVGGGIRSLAQVEELLEIGVDRVVIGSLAVRQPELVIDWLNRFGSEAICLALDVNISPAGEKLVALSGWQQHSGVALEALTRTFLDAGLKHALVTDISRDGTLGGANTSLYRELSDQFPDIRWQASGGIASLEDVEAVKNSGAASVIIGKALLIDNFTVGEAIACWPNAT
ncbi:MAG: 1-(5-phosphoribosyl)-5-[(5-phosphoribosylamino)methylideneamino]imidazole-4-carboxamide isomerase [Shewanella sp.]|nr:1-(5-phosphoribosyl)-5-[(5-phosphoribosylamino)methylideneamino]imidazole-4-carboxamide isomerase [Shewanella sp.]MCF1430815.1 1-(5-phosphoribosyl)-5-[(5-phosphoribosylamino)methylideneamino]imidazole-4-carboxamide isomerase [Shewanella sp.]MCF1439041.1 1-(5-phosphoribosyl)-5-[(5-phosphoribosylamino)methylideneamino]imidazole-4-carboxamide isomerase [Shewanella sp.]MCF1458043.1 1-(5-phosphoribosyl)-5-[(5-phosphoribosylamino)methylideneamino]imidazole-4-carboxamide isomerase [Shewanella sp.]